MNLHIPLGQPDSFTTVFFHEKGIRLEALKPVISFNLDDSSEFALALRQINVIANLEVLEQMAEPVPVEDNGCN